MRSNMIKRFYDWFLGVSEQPQTWLAIIGWWELRRIPYNLIVGGVGFISLLLFFLFINLAHELQPGEDAIEPLALLAAPVLLNIA